MFCENCGNKLPDGAKFCDSCGAPLQLPESAQDSGYQQDRGSQQDADYQQDMGYQRDADYQQDMGYQQDNSYQQGMSYEQNMNYQQQYAPKSPRKPIPKKYLIIGGAVAAACLVLAVAIPLISSAIQSSKDKKNTELYEQYVEELETTNQKAAQNIIDQIAGTTGSDDAKKKIVE